MGSDAKDHSGRKPAVSWGQEEGTLLAKASRRGFMGDMDTELAPEDGGKRGRKGDRYFK